MLPAVRRYRVRRCTIGSAGTRLRAERRSQSCLTDAPRRIPAPPAPAAVTGDAPGVMLLVLSAVTAGASACTNAQAGEPHPHPGFRGDQRGGPAVGPYPLARAGDAGPDRRHGRLGGRGAVVRLRPGGRGRRREPPGRSGGRGWPGGAGARAAAAHRGRPRRGDAAARQPPRQQSGQRPRAPPYGTPSGSRPPGVRRSRSFTRAPFWPWGCPPARSRPGCRGSASSPAAPCCPPRRRLRGPCRSGPQRRKAQLLYGPLRCGLLWREPCRHGMAGEHSFPKGMGLLPGSDRLKRVNGGA